MQVMPILSDTYLIYTHRSSWSANSHACVHLAVAKAEADYAGICSPLFILVVLTIFRGHALAQHQAR